jgi:L-aspartate oxidase
MAIDETQAFRADLLVIGSGVAGLFAALTAIERGEDVFLVTKRELEESNSRYAQGGIAAPVGREDYPDLHALDTIRAGAGINDPAAVTVLTSEARGCIEKLEELGVPFDRSGDALAVTREAAHSVPRVIHAGGDATGAAVEHTLASQFLERGGRVLENTFVTQLTLADGRVTGACLVGSDGAGGSAAVLADRVILATGGAGQLFSRTTNPDVATGDGLALAYEAGAELMDLEFFQFHPTALALEGLPAFLISEAARGEGGVLRDLHRNAFMRNYHEDAELAPRDIVSRSIAAEMKRQDIPNVLLDLTHLGRSFLQQRFPTIFATCASYGIDISRTPIPIAPAAHYFMGGVRTDQYGRTSLPGLLAVGEVACTGVHGANRLASNSLLEGLVFGRRAALAGLEDQETSQGRLGGAGHSLLPDIDGVDGVNPVSRHELQTMNWSDLGVNRDEAGLRRALQLYGNVSEAPPTADMTTEQRELRNMRLVSLLISRAALERTESRGAHFRTDFPASNPDWTGHIVLRKDELRFLQTEAQSEERASA